jgi:hypothetical protein
MARSARAALPAALALLTLAALVPLWIPGPLPLQDLPNHLLKVDVLQRWLAGDAQVREVFDLNLRAVPNLTCYVVLLALSSLMDLMTAARLYLSGCVLALCWASWVLVRRVNPEDATVVLVAPGLVYTDFLSKGFLNFVLALPLYAIALTLLAKERLGRRDAGWLCLLATLLYFTHGFVFLTLCGAVVGLALLMRLPARELAVRIACVLPGAVLFAVWLRGGVGGTGVVAEVPIAQTPSVAMWDALGWLFGMAYGSGFAALWLVALAAIALWSAGDLVRRAAAWRAALSARDALLVLAALMIALYFATASLMGPNVSVRLVPLAILSALGGLRLPRVQVSRAAVGMLLVFATLGLVVRNAQAYARGGAEVAEYLRGLEVVEPGASLLPVDLDEQVAGARAALHAWAYYHIGRGGWGPYAHAWRSQHPVAYRALPWRPAEPFRAGWLTAETERRAEACYDYVLVWGERDGESAGLAKGFVPVYGNGRLHIWANRAGVRKRPPAAVPECLAGGS